MRRPRQRSRNGPGQSLVRMVTSSRLRWADSSLMRLGDTTCTVTCSSGGADRYGEKYYGESPSADPMGPASGQWRVMRGGGWYLWPNHRARSAILPVCRLARRPLRQRRFSGGVEARRPEDAERNADEEGLTAGPLRPRGELHTAALARLVLVTRRGFATFAVMGLRQ